MTFASIQVVSSGDTCILRKPGNDIRHLWAVLTDPDQDDKVVIVNLTTRQTHSDDTVILDRGDHPFIRHETVIFYQDTRLVNAYDLTKAVRGGAATMHNRFRADVLTKIQCGLEKSPYTPNAIKIYFQRQSSSSLP